uniref:Fe2OG dioxygenase domain-containing protein n=1 Tax=Noctiluca scintillans TaxID=2966 RepID=A0A7S1B1W6_NOCSC|mmetsp:Transcript_8588/g.23915  ORF Transcript_8588/g.23915 Transcript_8588/m.23915 type:complete len:519 (+) Transcript_8588:39-1595(+)
MYIASNVVFALVTLSAVHRGVLSETELIQLQQNKSITLGGRSVGYTEIATQWPGVDREAELVVLSSLLSHDEVSQLLRVVQAEEFDEDTDSVDGLPTFEFYIEAHNSKGLARVEGKPDVDPDIFARRAGPRERLVEITAPIVERLTPFINEQYPGCKGRCHVCHSLVRRYLDGERRGHLMHFDIQALVTVVMGLNDHATDFTGGLFVSAGAARRFVPLQAGDAAVHQSDLLHGVQVTNGTRWSWIIWMQDSPTCSADPVQWHLEAAEEGDPVAQFLTASRYGLGRIQQRTKWMQRSAKKGFSRAACELGLAYRDGTGVKKNVQKAKMWLEKAMAASEPESFLNYGLLHLDAGEIDEAVHLFKKAAEAGVPGGAENLATAYSKGAGGLPKDLNLAASWYEAAGTAPSLYKRALVTKQMGYDDHSPEVMAWIRKAANAGHREACHFLARSPGSTKSDIVRCLSKHSDASSFMALADVFFRSGSAEDEIRGQAALRHAAALGSKEAQSYLNQVQTMKRSDL